MGKKQNAVRLQPAIPVQNIKPRDEPKAKSGGPTPSHMDSVMALWALPAIFIATIIAYIPAFNAGFVNWDDEAYVLLNPLIKDLSNFKAFFTTPVEGNYHPLTMLSLALNYAISGLEPWSYHLLNILLHLVNCALAFRLALLLSNRNIIIAFVTAILFGIHPMHVESVAWVSERKDVLYSLFFLAGLITYTKYLDSRSARLYWLTMFFLCLSLLSKPAAVIFPVVLFCIDLLRESKLTWKLFLEKVPFFIVAGAMGVVTVIVQRDAGAVAAEYYTPLTRFLFACYGIMMYVIKMVAPVNLTPFYPFPATNEGLPPAYYLSLFFLVGLVVLFVYSLKRNRVVAFGLAFFIVNLVLVLQFLSVGSAIIADRYTYLPYIGLFFIVGWLVNRYWDTTPGKAGLFFAPVILILVILSYKQSAIWVQSASLWDHAIEVHPNARVYHLRAVLFRAEKDYLNAIDHFNESILLRPGDHEALTNRGMTYMDMGRIDEAYNDFKTALLYKPDEYSALDNVGVVLAMKGQYDSSLVYLNKAIAVNNEYYSPYRNRGLTYLKLNRLSEAISDFNKYLQHEPNAFATFNTLGVCYQNLGMYQESVNAISKAISLKPEPVFYLNRSYSYNGLKNAEAARSDALLAKEKGVQLPDEYARSLSIN
jgi:tetratricopeptide (TPR) repeat protein